MYNEGIGHGMVEVERRKSARQNESDSEKVFKPKTVKEYNLHARGIDKGDMLMELYNSGRKTRKW